MSDVQNQTSRDQTLQELSRHSTSAISDALDKLGIAGQIEGVLPIDRGMRLIGRAFTVKYVDIGDVPGTVGDYIDDLNAETVVVLDNAGRADATVWGDILTEVAHAKHIAGTVIDGVCRDTDKAVELGYPLFSRSRWMRTGKDRVKVESYQQPVTIGGVLVAPGDVLLGDADGVVAIPADRVAEVVEIAQTIDKAEESIRQAVRSGASLREAREKAGYHTLQTREEKP